MKLILPLLLAFAAAPALAHKDHDDEVPVIKPQQIAPKADAAPAADTKKASKPKPVTPPAAAAEPAAKPKSGG